MTVEQERSSEDYLRCEICGGNCQVINILPLRQPDGRLNTLACKECINQKVEAERPVIVELFKQKINLSTQKEPVIAALVRWSEFLSDTRGLPYEENVARAIVTASFRLDGTPEEIIKQVCDEGPEIIFPPFYLAGFSDDID